MVIGAVAAVAFFGGAAVGAITNQIRHRRLNCRNISSGADLVISLLPDKPGLLPENYQPTSEATLTIELLPEA